MQENKHLLIVGLGNYTKEYDLTRHNAGFMTIDSFNLEDWKTLKNASVSTINISDKKVIFVKPLTFMNDSGVAVQGLMQFYKIDISDLIVIHDDLDIKLGEFREKIGGSSAGHNGIKSIDKLVGNNYKRIRIGISHPKDINLQISVLDWVLGKFTKDELEIIDNVIKNVKLRIEEIIKNK